VDFVLHSITAAIKNWYEEYYQYDPWDIIKKAHISLTVSFYDRERFSNHETIGKERDAYLTEIDLYVQMRRDE